MKNTQLYLTFFVLISIGSCSIDEEPVFFSNQNLFDNAEGANAVLNGVFTAADNSLRNGFPQVVLSASGLLGINTLPFSTTIGSLAPLPSNTNLEQHWRESYATIGLANNFIAGLSTSDIGNQQEQDNMLGQAYFVRSWIYFNLVRIWGGVPLVIEPATLENINQPRASIMDVYNQIIKDAELAKNLLKDIGLQNLGRPAKPAASMLLAKVYITLAGDRRHSETDYWQKAYNEAIEVYGKYSLLPDFGALWYEETGDNTAESVFELQGNITYGAASNWEKLFSGVGSNAGRTADGKIWANLEVYDSHIKRYPSDPRIDYTFVTSFPIFNGQGVQSTQTTYPLFTNRGNANRSYPKMFKYFVKDIHKINSTTNKNIIIYRYADLLLMLAEIENEINGPELAYQYVNQVLKRARESSKDQGPSLSPEDWSNMTQAEFRASIMKEYQYELFGEGHEWFNVRRRGYDYFKASVIDVHNNFPAYDFSRDYDNRYPENDRIMLLPIPLSELATNSSLNLEDQNPGY